MPMRFLHSTVVVGALMSSVALAESPFWKNQDLDYWREGRTLYSRKARETSLTNADRKEREAEFWQSAMNPDSKAFWDDEAVSQVTSANPSEENIGRYLAWKAKKQAVVSSFIEKVVAKENLQLLKLREDEYGTHWPELEMTYYYSSNCSACAAHRSTVQDLLSRKVTVRFVRLDDSEPMYDDRPATHEEKSFVKVTPTLIVSYRSQGKVLVGAQSVESIAEALRSPK